MEMDIAGRGYGIRETDRHEELNPFYAANGLEIAEDEPVSTDTVKSWIIPAMTDTEKDGVQGAEKGPAGPEDGRLYVTGACTLAFRQGEYIIDGIAVSEELRGSGAGSALLHEAEKEAAARGGKRIYLVARAPGFFRENGYETVERKNAPEFFECFGCDQYRRSCFPEVMRHDL